MSEAREFLIVKNLQAALLAITVAGGYFHDVAGMAVKLDPNLDVDTLVAPDGPRPFIVLEVHPETRDYTTISRNAVKITRPVSIHWVSDAQQADDDTRMQAFFRGCADVEQAIAKDISRGGLALQTLVTNTEFALSDDGAQVYAVIHAEISLQRLYGVPNA